MELVVVGSRAEVASSQRSTFGSVASARAMATPLLLTAGELGGIGTCLFLQTHQIQQFQSLFLSLGLGYTGKLHGEADIFQTGPLHQQVEALERSC